MGVRFQRRSPSPGAEAGNETSARKLENERHEVVVIELEPVTPGASSDVPGER